MEITIRLSEFNSPEVIVINPDLTAQETIQVISQKFNLTDLINTQLVLAPTSKKNGSSIAPRTVLRNLIFNPKQDIFELWRAPQLMNVAIYFKESGQDIIRDRKRIPVDYGIPLFKMIPTMQRAFELPNDQEFSFQYAHSVDDYGKVEQNRWLNIQLSLEEQEARSEGFLLLYPTTKLLKTPESSLVNADKAWIFKRSVKKDHTTNKQKRLFVLHEGFLFYYKKERESSAAGLIPLEYYVIVKGDKKKKHNILLNLSKDVLPSNSSLTSSYKLQFDTAELLESWYEKIKRRCVNNNNKKIFGIDLKEVVSRKSNTSKYIPNIVKECIEQIDEKGINQEGIFRLSASALTISHYKEKYDSGEAVDFSKIVDINVASGLLKLYFRELPEPLFTFDLYDKFTSLAQYPEDSLPQKIAEVFSELPLENYATIKYLATFLSKVAKSDDVNKMGAQNLATVFGPNLLRHINGDSVQDFSIVNKIIETLILKSEEIINATESLNSSFTQCPRFGPQVQPPPGGLSQSQPLSQVIQSAAQRGRRLKGPTVGQDRHRPNNSEESRETTPPLISANSAPSISPNPGNPMNRIPPPNLRPPPRKSTTMQSDAVNNNNNNNNINNNNNNPSPPPLLPREKSPSPSSSPSVSSKSVDDLVKELEDERKARKKLEADFAAMMTRIAALEQKLGMAKE